jgi:hypothetical protein
MSVGDLLSGIGRGVATAGRVAGAVLEPIAKRTAEVVSGEAPELDEERRQQAMQLSDQQRELKANDLESQLEMGRKYGTLTPEQQKQYVDQITGLYSKPEQQGSLLQRIHKAIHPTGTVRQAAQPLPSAIPAGGTAAADERNKVGSLLDEDALKKQQALQSIDWFKKNMLPQFPPDQQAAKLNAYIDHINGITQGTEKPPKGLKAMDQGGVFFGVEDQDTGKQYLKAQLEPGGDAPPEAKQMYAAVQKAAKDKQDAADAKENEKQKHEDKVTERQARQLSASFDRLGMSEQFTEQMGEYRSNLLTYRNLDTEARKSEETVKALEAQYSTPGNKAAVDNELQNFFTTVVQKGGRKTAAELALTLKIGSFGMNLEQMATKASKGELPPDLRKMFLDGMKAVAAEQRAVADQVKPELPALPQRPGAKPATGAKQVGPILSKAGAQPSGGAVENWVRDPKTGKLVKQ